MSDKLPLYRIWTGPADVAREAAYARDNGLCVEIEGTEHIFVRATARQLLNLWPRHIQGMSVGVRVS